MNMLAMPQAAIRLQVQRGSFGCAVWTKKTARAMNHELTLSPFDNRSLQKLDGNERFVSRLFFAVNTAFKK